MHSIHGWKDDEVSFPTHPTVCHLDFLGRSYDQNIKDCLEAQKTRGNWRPPRALIFHLPTWLLQFTYILETSHSINFTSRLLEKDFYDDLIILVILQPSYRVLTQTLVLPGLVKRFLWDPLVRALRVPVRLPRLVWISSGCSSAVIWRRVEVFVVSVPLSPSLGLIQPWLGIKLVISLFFSKLPFDPRCLVANYLDRDLLSWRSGQLPYWNSSVPFIWYQSTS